MKQVHYTIKTTTNPYKFHPKVINNTNIAFSGLQKGFKSNCNFNLSNTKRKLLYLNTQSVPCSKHFPPRL